MSDDSSNPFKKLAKDFAERENPPAGPSGASGRGPAGGSGRKPGTGEEPDVESSLFLDAMSRIKPLRGKERKPGGQPLAEKLAASMRGAFEQEDHAQARKPVRDIREKRPQPGSPAGPEAVESGGNRLEESFAELLASEIRQDNTPDDHELALFAKAMRGVAPVSGKGREIAAPAGGLATPPAVDPAKALRDLLEGRVQFALHHIDEYMEGFVVGVDPLVLARLRSGQYSPEKHIDLHGMNSRQAYDALVLFIKNAYQRSLRCVVVVTGRGRNSPDGVGILRPMLQRWLCREPLKRVVLAFCTAKPGDGGPGAVYVLLRKYKKSRGKIIWEHTPSDDDFPDL